MFREIICKPTKTLKLRILVVLSPHDLLCFISGAAALCRRHEQKLENDPVQRSSYAVRGRWAGGGAGGGAYSCQAAPLTCGTPIFLQASRKFSTFLRHLAMLSLGWKGKKKKTPQQHKAKNHSFGSSRTRITTTKICVSVQRKFRYELKNIRTSGKSWVYFGYWPQRQHICVKQVVFTGRPRGSSLS